MSTIIIIICLLTYIISALNIYIKHETAYNKITWIILIIATVGLIYGVLTPQYIF